MRNASRNGAGAYPDNVAGNEIESAIRDYVNAYPDYVKKVYEVIRPWDSKTGTGVVVTRPLEGLLFPAAFSADAPPTLKQIWDAQEKIWLQHTLLEVVNTVNKNSKSWDDAIIKQISAIDVGVESAMDQTWLAEKEETRDKLKTAPEILPGNPPPVEEKADAKSEKDPQAMMRSVGSNSDPNEVSYLEPGGGQYRLFPIYLSVTIDQRHLNDLFHALRNSPMAIQVKEVEIARPEERVKRPEKGEETAFGSSMAGGSDYALHRRGQQQQRSRRHEKIYGADESFASRHGFRLRRHVRRGGIEGTDLRRTRLRSKQGQPPQHQQNR